MKKILSLLGIVLLMAACSDDYDNWLDPQQNDPEAAYTVDMTVGAVGAVDYADLTAENVQLFVPSLTADEGTETTYKVVLYNDDKSKSTTLTTDAEGKVTAEELRAAVIELYGKAPKERTLQMDITAYTVVNGQTVANKATSTIKVTLTAAYIDANGYYLVGDMFKVTEGDEVKTYGWDVAGAHAFTHLGDGDVYDYPEFQITFQTKAENQYWKIIPAGNYNGDFWNESETGVVGVAVNGDDSFEGNLVTTAPQAGMIAKAGIYRMTINMQDYTYTIEELQFAEYIWQAGNANGWGNPADPLYGPNFDGKYTGYMYLDGEFKLRSQETNWDAPDWGWGDPEGTLVAQAGNLWAKTGYYKVDADLSAMTWSLTPINTIGVVGPGQPGGWDADTDLTYNVETGAWEGIMELTAGEIKFRANDGWDINWGGSLGNLTQGGDNIAIEEAGTYKIQLFARCDTKAYANITKQ